MLIFNSYKAGAVVCGVGAYICNKLGHTVGQDVLATGAFCCGGMAAAVTAAQSQRWRDGATALGTAAQVIGGKSVAFGRDAMYVARCGINVCTMVINLARGNAPALRSIDAPPAYKNKNLVSGYAQPQLEIKEDTVRLARYTDEPKSEKNVFDIN